MDSAVRLLVSINFLYIGLLPLIFFRRDGKLTSRWWSTALPFFVCFLALQVSHFDLLPLARPGTLLKSLLELSAVFLSVLSIALISFTLGTHRIPIALWHQSNDAPAHLVTYGAYKHIRHPFYAAFLLAFMAALAAEPNVVSIASFLWGACALNYTAAGEEAKLLSSQFGKVYKSYMQSTGRFFPRVGVKRS